MAMTMEEAAKAIGGAVSRAKHITYERSNRVAVETRKFVDVAMAAADGFDKKYADLLEQAEKFVYTVKTLAENDCPSALDGLENGIQWLSEHKNESVDKSFLGYYERGSMLDIYKSEIKLAREAAGLTQQEFADIFDISINTIKNWDCGRRRPDKFKENLILEKLAEIKEKKGL